jgi:hypothetical protein
MAKRARLKDTVIKKRIEHEWIFDKDKNTLTIGNYYQIDIPIKITVQFIITTLNSFILMFPNNNKQLQELILFLFEYLNPMETYQDEIKE